MRPLYFIVFNRRAEGAFRAILLALLCLGEMSRLAAQSTGPIGGTTPPGGGVITNPGGSVTPPGGSTTPPDDPTGITDPNDGNITLPGPSSTGRILAAAGLLVGEVESATAFPPSSGSSLTDNTTPTDATYVWSITGGRIIGSTTASTVSFTADKAGTVTLSVAITANGTTTTTSSTVTAISASLAGALTAPEIAAAAISPQAATITASVPAAQNGDRTFRWAVTGDAALVSGQGTATATFRAGSPGLKEITCDVTLQRLVTVTLRSYLVVNGDGPPTVVTINNGTGGGTYNTGSRVDIFAHPPAAGQVFDRWVGDTSAFGASATLAPLLPHNIITVPAAPITLTATYRTAPTPTVSSVSNFNPQTTGTGAAQTTMTTTLYYALPAEPVGLVFLLHETEGSAAAWFNTPEPWLLVRDLFAAGYGVAAVNCVNRTSLAWGTQATLATNFDALNHVAALNKLAAERAGLATKPLFFLGVGTGGAAAVQFAEFLATASPARPVKGAILYHSAGSETLAVISKVPQYFALAANASSLGVAGLASARNNAQLLAGRGIASGTSTNAVSPVHANRFRALGVTTASFTAADATAVWTAVKAAGFLDSNLYLKGAPTTAALTAALPEAYRPRVDDISAQLQIARASDEFYGEANARILAFLADRVAGVAAPAPGRLANLSTRSKISYVGDSFSLGFSLSGSDRATLLIRGVGPALARFGVATALGTPRLEVNDSSGRVIASNERWDAPGGSATGAQVAAAAASVGAFALTPGDYDAAVLLTNLAPGSYTATIKGVNGATGDVLAEVYDVTKNSTRLTNLSTLAKISEEGDLLIPGIVLQGTTPRTLLVRAVGPGLSDFGVPTNAILTDPRITVLNAAGLAVAANNNWTMPNSITLAAVFPAVGAFPLKTSNPADAALVTVLSSGNFTLQAGAALASPDAASINLVGTVLVEVYEVP